MVLDACALIAFFNDEAGAGIVASLLEGVRSVEMSAVNLLEIAYDSVRRTGDPQSAAEVLDAVRQLPIKIHWNIDDSVFFHVAGFKSACRISLADAFALALAKIINQWRQRGEVKSLKVKSLKVPVAAVCDRRANESSEKRASPIVPSRILVSSSALSTLN